MPYKDKRKLYAAQKRYRRRKVEEQKAMKEKLEFYEKTYGIVEWEVI